MFFLRELRQVLITSPLPAYHFFRYFSSLLRQFFLMTPLVPCLQFSKESVGNDIVILLWFVFSLSVFF